DGSAVISDFGIARALSGHVASTGVDMAIRTPQYLSPEQAQGRPLDARVDFYALGVTLFKAATGEVPFTSSDWFELARMHVEQAPPSLRKRRPELSKRFERVVMKCLAKHPDDRYRDAADLLADVGGKDGTAGPGLIGRLRRWWSGGRAAEQAPDPGPNVSRFPFPVSRQHRLRGSSQFGLVLTRERSLGEPDLEPGAARHDAELHDPRRRAIDHVDQGL